MDWIHKFQLFLFDFDGLLVNTDITHYQAYVTLMQRHGYTLEWSYAYYCQLAHLHPLAVKNELYSQFPALDPNWEALYAEKKAIYVELIAQGTIALMPGVERLLKALAQANIRRCTVTHSVLEHTLLIRAELPILETIPKWITREDYDKPKPDPECYLKAIQLYAQKGDRIIGFEDSLRGIEALRQTPALPVLICPVHYPLLDMATAEEKVLHFVSFEDITQIRPLAC